MSAFIILDTQIHDADAYEEYKRLAKPIVERFGGVYRVRGGALEVRQDELWTPTRMVVIEFPDLESAHAFADSAEYAEVEPLRRNNAACTLVIASGD